MAVVVAVFLFVLMTSLGLGFYVDQRATERQRAQVAAHRLGGGLRVTAAEMPRGRSERPRVVGRGEGRVGLLAGDLIARAGMDLSPRALLLGAPALMVLGTTLAASRLQPLFAVGCGLALGCAPIAFLRARARRRLKQLAEQLPYVLDMLASSLESGHTPLRGLQISSHHIPEPLAGELHTLVYHVRVGMTLPM